MPKRTNEQELQRLWKSGHADISERERLISNITEKEKLRGELSDLRNRYKIAFKNISEQVQWFKSQGIETLASFSSDVEAIKKVLHQ